jgi:glutathione synthase/RimK-type ligase-like ATP-grasp enzyme
VTEVALVGCSLAEDPDVPVLAAALERLGFTATALAWDDEDADWSRFAATVIRSTWDYFSRLDEFLAWSRSVRSLINPASVVEWNSDKRYLEALRDAGVPTIDTQYLSAGDDATFPAGEFVVKPTVGGGSRGAARFASDDVKAARAHLDHLFDEGFDVMVQPFVGSVDAVGETDLIVIDGEVSHAIVKHAPLGATLTSKPAPPARSALAQPTAEHRAVAAAALAVVPHDGPLCYARVDLVATERGPAVIELELIEPYLFFDLDPSAAGLLASAIVRRATR